MSYVNRLLGQNGASEIAGLVEVGDYEEVGRKVAKAMGRMPGSELTPGDFMVTKPETLRRAPLGFPGFTLGAAIGAVDTQSAKVQRKYHPDRLLIIPSAAGIVVDSIKVGDSEQLLATGVPVELYGTNALTDSLPDNFKPVPSGNDVSMTLRNTTAGALTALAGMKGAVER